MLKSKVSHYQAELKSSKVDFDATKVSLAELVSERNPIEKRSNQVYDSIFSNFCKKLKIKNIREYESLHRAGLGEHEKELVKFNSQISLLESR